MLSALSAAIFRGDPENRPSTVRQTLQAMYLERLLAMANSGQQVSATQAAALSEVLLVRTALENGQILTGTPQHQALLLYKIRRALDEGKN
jgi:DNA-binding GntR family transcriptional regulator